MSTAAANTANQEQLRVIRQALSSAQQLCAQSADLLDEPFRSMFTGLKKQFDEKLTAMPPTEMVPAATEMHWQLQSLFYCLDRLNEMVRTLNQSLSGMKSATASTVSAAIEAQVKEGKLITAEALATAVTAEVENRTKSGELIAKDTVTQMCSTAEGNGMVKGEAKVRQEIAAAADLTKKIGERKTGITTASLPLPPTEDLLGGTDEEFATRRTTAEGRLKELGEAGFSLNSDLQARVWLPESAYKDFRALLDTMPGLKGGAQPFATGTAPKPGETAEGKLGFIV
jgi:hypothetical protein